VQLVAQIHLDATRLRVHISRGCKRLDRFTSGYPPVNRLPFGSILFEHIGQYLFMRFERFACEVSKTITPTGILFSAALISPAS
jgi:hypothetical protein